MNRSLNAVCDSLIKARERLGDVLSLVRHEREDTILDYYKGMEIYVRASRFGANAWTCSIRIGNPPHRTLQNLAATVRATEDGVSLQAALGLAFTEAMSLCDLLIERKRLR